MVPPDEGTTFVVIEAELTLEVFVGALDSPSVLGGGDEFCERDRHGQRG